MTSPLTTAGINLPRDFLFGAATASYQIEGGVAEGGRGRSIWDDFCDVPGRIKDGSSGAVACDSYHRYGEDITLMRELGLDAYRFSFAWPRIQPGGRGAASPAGLDYYDRLIDGLLAAGLAPAATLFHWDLPSALQAEGGWTSRDTTDRFGEYAALLASHFADRVAMWMPVNEPSVVSMLGHRTGEHAPGLTLGHRGVLQVAHHLMLGHGKAVSALRAAGAASVGCANNHSLVEPASCDEADIAAATQFDALDNRMYAEPLLLGGYPEGVGELLSGPVSADLAVISAPLDFYGVNSYAPTRVGAATGAAAGGASGTSGQSDAMDFAVLAFDGYERTDFGWPIRPDAFRDLLVHLHATYGDRLPPLYITENGCAFGTGPDDDGVVCDTRRVQFYESHLRAVAEAIAAGAPVQGYFAWSLLDNFEWAEGYTQRFGLVWVDFDTLERIPKDSFRWLQGLIAQVSG